MTRKGRAVAIWPVVMPFLNPLPGLTGKVRKPLFLFTFLNLALVSNFFFNFLLPYLQHMEFPGLRIEPAPPQQSEWLKLHF